MFITLQMPALIITPENRTIKISIPISYTH